MGVKLKKRKPLPIRMFTITPPEYYPQRFLNRLITILLICGIILIVCIEQLYAQKNINRFGVHVINTKAEYLQNIHENSGSRLVNIKNYIPGVVTELRYASGRNFMHRRLYKRKAEAYLLQPAAIALIKIQQHLNMQDLEVKIFDAYRPYHVTVKMWTPLRDENYVANPAKGSGHNRGAALDLTLINTNTKEEVNMGTGFDNFTDSAHHDFMNLPDTVLAKRKMLRGVMESYGFKAFESEWWHYSWPDAVKYPLLNLSFETLKKLE